MSVADWFSGMRLLLIPFLWALALTGHGQLVGIGLVVAGATDLLDGYLARRLHQQSPRGARLDSVADNLLLLSAAACIEILHPEILRENTLLTTVTLAVYAACSAVSLLKFHQLANLHLYSSKVAGGLLYSFAVITVITGSYAPLLLVIAAAAFIVSSAETLLALSLVAGPDEDLGSLVLARKRRAAQGHLTAGRE